MSIERPAAFAALLACAVVWGWTSLAHCEPMPLYVACQRLQPRLTDQAAMTWAKGLRRAARDANVDPYLLAAMVMRESSFDPRVATGAKRGALGEIGPLQLHPRGVALRYLPPGCPATNPGCNLRAGALYLAAVRERCPGSWARWVGSYGSRGCMSESRALTHRSVRRLRRFYCRIRGRQCGIF